MADGPRQALIKGVIAALKADATMAGLVNARIYSAAPQKVTFPYVRIDRTERDPWDTDGTLGSEITLGIAVHTRVRQHRAANEAIQDAIINVLHRGEETVSVTGFDLVELVYLTAATDREDDGKSWVGRMAFRALLDS